MDRLRQLITPIASELDAAVEPHGSGIDVLVPLGKRRQRVTIRRDENHYVMTTVVLSSAEVTQTLEDWEHYARLAWQRNADCDIVTFGFDRRERLIGTVRHPCATLDAEELALYVRSLSRECDRFEYLLTGQDQH